MRLQFFFYFFMSRLVAAVLLAVLAAAVPCWANFELLQQKYTADPAPLVYKDRVCVAVRA